ncbi:MAG: 2-hydroxychromene-2-carboxylate isomerase [Proteobacteria bacterium]|jgi:2-hydroxychromene-2-carboxylate isomerase|nr:2-hydroxychromene-2-carboxylate isomerase [Pseudomonadota bacterium]
MTEIEYFYASYSGYAYLGSKRLMEIANLSGHTIKHRPFDLRAIMAAAGGQPFSERTTANIEYFFGRELERWSEFREAPMLKRLPTHHSNSITPSNTMLIAGLVKGINIDNLAQEMMMQHWAYDCDLADTDTLAKIALSVDIDPLPLLEISNSKEVLKIYAENTKEAIEKSVFGSPTYFVDGDMFYGQDRLELVERALVTPFNKRIAK